MDQGGFAFQPFWGVGDSGTPPAAAAAAVAQGRTRSSSAQGDEDPRDRESELDRLTRRRAEKQAQRDYLAECSTESAAAVGSLDVEIAALSEQIDMAEQQPRESDEDRLAKALEQSRLEHDQARLDMATSASLVSSREFAQEQDIISVPPNFGDRDGHDAFIVLEGSAIGLDAAKALLQPLIVDARTAQGDESPQLKQMLHMGFIRTVAERALLESNGDVQRAANILAGEDERSSPAQASYEVDIFGPLWCGKLLVDPDHTLGDFRARLTEITRTAALVLTIDGRELMDETAVLEDCGVVPGARVTCRNMMSPQAKKARQQQEDDELRQLEHWGSRASFTSELQLEPEPEPEHVPEPEPEPELVPEPEPEQLVLPTQKPSAVANPAEGTRALSEHAGDRTPSPQPDLVHESVADAGLYRNRSPGWERACNQLPRKCTWGDWSFCIHVCDPPGPARLSLNHPSGVFLNLSQGSIGDFSWKFAKGSTDLVSSADGNLTAPWLDVTLVDRSTQEKRVDTTVAGQRPFYDLGSGWLTSAEPLQTSMLDGDTIELAVDSDYVFGSRSQWTFSHKGDVLSIRNAHAGAIPTATGSSQLGSLIAHVDPSDATAAKVYCIRLEPDGVACFIDPTGQLHLLSEATYSQIVGQRNKSPSESFTGRSSLLNSGDLVIHPDAIVPMVSEGSLAVPISPDTGDSSHLAEILTTNEKEAQDLATLVGSCPSPSRFGSADSRISNEDLRLSTGESISDRIGSLPLNLEARFFAAPDLVPTPTKQASMSGSSVVGSGVLVPPDLDQPLEGTLHAPSDDDDCMFEMSPRASVEEDGWPVQPPPTNAPLAQLDGQELRVVAEPLRDQQDCAESTSGGNMTPPPPVGQRSVQDVEPEPEPIPEPEPSPVQQNTLPSAEPAPPQFAKEPKSSYAANVRIPKAPSGQPVHSTGVGTSWLDVGASMAPEPRRTGQLPSDLQPKKRFVRDGSTIRFMDVEVTQGCIMFAVQSILDTRIAFDRVTLITPRGDSQQILCHAQNKEPGAPAHCDSSLVKRIYGEVVSNFRFRSPAPAVDCLRVVDTVREAIETDVGAPIAFRVLIQRSQQDTESPPQDMERWYIVLDHTHPCATADASKRRHTKLVKDSIVAMRTLHQFVRLVPGYQQFRAVVPRGGGRTTKRSLEFVLGRINPRDVPTQTMHATSLETPFGNISVSLEFDLACEVVLPTPRPLPAQGQPSRVPSPPQLSTSPPQVDTPDTSETQRSIPASALSDMTADSTAEQPSGFDSCTPGVTPGHKHPGDTIGKYFLEVQLGAGQYGRVFRATTKPDDGSTPVRLAIKSIDRQSLCDAGGNLDEKKKSYVESEIRVMQSVQHSNIVRLYEPLYSETNIFLVLEYCDLDLSKYMNGNKFSTPQIRPRAPLSEIEAQEFMHHLAAGLQHLREHNVVHRDLKPENLLLSGSLDTGFTLKIADFGMARTLEGAQQLANTMCGSPAFMAPEVFLMRQRGQPGYDDKADLWSVGCILYFMLTKNMVTPAQNHVHLAQELQTAAEKEHREGKCVRELESTYKVQQEVPGTVQDFKAVVDATGQSVESKKMRGWRVALAKQAGVSVDDLRIVKTANQPRTQRGGGRSTVVLTYEFSVNASEPCRELLRSLLIHNPEVRCSWEAFLSHPWLATDGGLRAL